MSRLSPGFSDRSRAHSGRDKGQIETFAVVGDESSVPGDRFAKHLQENFLAVWVGQEILPDHQRFSHGQPRYIPPEKILKTGLHGFSPPISASGPIIHATSRWS